MRTVQSLIDELKKFPKDAACYAYEGEVCGVVVVQGKRSRQKQGVVHCAEYAKVGDDYDTELLE